MRVHLFLILLLMTACDYEAIHERPPVDPAAALDICTPDGVVAGIDYEQVRTQVFEPKCFSCHGGGSRAGGVDLSTFASAKTWAGMIKEDVINNVMPKSPNPPLPQAEKDLVIAWVDAGAPETIGGAGQACPPDGETPEPGTETPSPVDPQPPAESPLTEVPPDGEINYSLVREKIFKFRCFSCHSIAGGNRGRLNLETYFNTIDEIDDVYEEVSERSMPPSSRPALNEIERTTLLRWIELDAPQ